ncbi:MAG: polyphosphate polymerase domain-containing protein [Pseudobdellovibrio sp.]
MSSDNSDFVRYEDKYVITNEVYSKLLPLLNSELENAAPQKDTRYTEIESIYFDNTDLDILQDYLNKLNNRAKVRIRRYAPNSIWSSEYFTEFKTKIDGISKKNRFPINQTELTEIINTSTVSSSLNKTNKKIINKINLINAYLADKKARPICNVTYSREAFEKNDFRVTIDTKLSIQPHLESRDFLLKGSSVTANQEYLADLDRCVELYNENQYILEIKHQGTIPIWMQNFLNENHIAKIKFSKYCYAMAVLLRR